MSIVTADDLRARLAGVATITEAGLEVSDERRFREEIVDGLAFEAVFAEDAAPRRGAMGDLERMQALGCGSASIHACTVPRPRRGGCPRSRAGHTCGPRPYHDWQAFATALGAMRRTSLEIAKREMAYNDQRRPRRRVVLDAAIREGWRKPVFLQATTYSSTRRSGPPIRAELRDKDLTREAARRSPEVDIDDPRWSTWRVRTCTELASTRRHGESRA